MSEDREDNYTGSRDEESIRVSCGPTEHHVIYATGHQPKYEVSGVYPGVPLN